jgi:hypothetical protein
VSGGRVFVCSTCSAVAEGDPKRRGCGLPRGWEHRDPSACEQCVYTSSRPPAELASPVCGSCVLALLESLEQAMREFYRRTLRT